MSIVDLAKARAFANVVAESEAEAADWIRELADEVESQQAALEVTRREGLAALADANKLRAERDQAVAALREFYDSVATLVKALR